MSNDEGVIHPTMTSYAGNFEDVLLNRIFRGVENGFYVDIGACQAKEGSTSYAFYERGWSGVNVEPGSLFETLPALRPSDINIKAAITDHDGEVEFFYHRDSPATSTILPNLIPQLQGKVKDRVTSTVRAMRMSTLVDRYIRDRHVNFLKVDVEGAEAAVFGSCDWKSFRPEVIVSEGVIPYTNTPVYQEWSEHLTNAKYNLTLFDGINVWFVREESPDLLPLASLPVNQLDFFVPYEVAKLRAELLALRKRR